MAVGKLRQHASKEVADLAKEIVKKWKNAVEKAKLGNGGSAKGIQNGKGAYLAALFLGVRLRYFPDRKGSVASNSGTPITPTGASAKLTTRSSKTDGVKGGIGDATRDKCCELIYDALASDSGARKYYHVLLL